MKIVLINASPRKNGATAKILTEFANRLRLCENTDVTLFHLSEINPEYCKGCCVCYKTGECFIKDDVEMLSRTIGESDGLIIGTPCYASNVSGQLKTLIDRGHFIFEQLLKGKHTVGVVTYENAESGAAFKVLKKLFLFSGAKSTDRLIVKLPFNSDPFADEKLKIKIETKSNNLYKAILKNKSYNFMDKIMHFFVFNFGIKPFVIRKGELYSGILMQWEKGGILRRN